MISVKLLSHIEMTTIQGFKTIMYLKAFFLVILIKSLSSNLKRNTTKKCCLVVLAQIKVLIFETLIQSLLYCSLYSEYILRGSTYACTLTVDTHNVLDIEQVFVQQ